MEITDAAAVAQVLAGDKDAFRWLVERHARSIYKVAYRMTGNQHDAEEIMQETFLRAYKKLENFELRSSFSTWLYRIAVNRALDFLKAKKMGDTYQIGDSFSRDEKVVPLAESSPGPDRVLLGAETKARILQAMENLTPAERIAFTMRHMEDKDLSEISACLRIKPNAAKNTIFRAVQKVRQELETLASTLK